MWLLQDTPALFTDFYELTMAQAYFVKGMRETASFEVFVRHLPEHWGFFVMAGLPEVESYLHEFRFAGPDIEYSAFDRGVPGRLPGAPSRSSST